MAFYREDIVSIELESGTVFRSFLNHTLGSGDQKANRFGVRLFRGGEPVSAESATVTGLFMAPDGTRYVISETSFPGSTGKEGNKAYVQLPPVCYAVTGQFTLAIKLTGGGVEGTMRIVDGTVDETGEDGAVVPTSTIPTTAEIIEAYEEAVAVMGGSVRFDATQSLTSTEKATARENINAADADTVDTIGENLEAVTKEADENKTGLKAANGMAALQLEFSAGYINPATLEIVTTGTGDHLISQPVQIPAMSLLYIPKVSKSQNTTLLCECNSSGTPVFPTIRGTMTSASTGEYIIVPVLYESYYIFGGNNTMTEYMKYYVKEFRPEDSFEFTKDTFSKYSGNPSAYDYAEGPIIDSGTTGGPSYLHTNNIFLQKGMTIEYWSAGSASNVALSKYNNATTTIIEPITHGNSQILHNEYTAAEPMYVRLSARVLPQSDGMSVVLPPELFHAWRVYYKPYHIKKHENSQLYQKHMTVIGDSLINGNTLGNGATWITSVGIKYGMVYTNLGINGNSVAEQSTETTNPAMVNRISTVPTDTEIFVILGGANDKRLNVPIGDIESADKTTFIGALNSIVSQMRTRCPKARILFMTTYNRYESRNTLGFGDADYAAAMIEAGKRNLIPVFDNFHCSGVNFLDDNLIGWMDESRNRQIVVDGETQYDDPTHHFSIEGYEWIQPLYEAYLSAGSATPVEPDDNAAQYGFIDELLENAAGAVAVTGSNQYVEPHGKYVTINGVCYFKIMFRNLANVTSGTGGTAVASLPAPAGSPVFFEVGRSQFSIGSRLIYNEVWRLQGTRRSGDYSLVYGSYSV